MATASHETKTTAKDASTGRAAVATPRHPGWLRVIVGLALAGLALVLLGVWNAAGQPPYDHALDRAVPARVGEALAIASAWLGGAVLIVAVALFGYWLVHASRERHRGAH